MAQFNWTNQRLESLSQEIEEGTLDDVNLYIDTECKGCLPSSYPTKRILQICCRTKKLDVLDALLDRGLVVSQFSMGDLFRSPNSSFGKTEFIDYDISELSTLKQLVLRMLDGGSKIIEDKSDFTLHMLEVYPEDIDFYERLHRAGLIFESDSYMYGNDGYTLAFSNGFWKTAEYFASIHVKCGIFSHSGYITKGWTPKAIDFLLKHRKQVSRFDENAPVETVVYAIKKGIKLKPYHDRDLHTYWDAVVAYDNTELGDALISEGVPFKDVSNAVPKDPNTLEWASRVGLNVTSVNSQCSKEVLIKAAELKIPPDDEQHKVIIYPTPGKYEELSFSSGGQYLSDQLDFDVIKAFLDAGFGDQLDPSRAIEQGRDDIVALFEQHGFSTSQVSISNGDKYVDENGIAVIPQGIVRIESGAFKNTPIKGVRFPDTIEHIGSDNFKTWGKIVSWDYVPDKYSVVLPKSVKTLSRCAFSGIPSISFYDSLDGGCIATMVGTEVGLNIFLDDCEFTVLSSVDDSVKFKVWRPGDDSLPRYRREIEEAWKPDCSYNFAVIDKLYPEFKTSEAKLHAAINRLAWPMDLDEKTAKKYQRYVTQHFDAAMEMLCSFKDADRVKAVLSFAALDSTQIEHFKELAMSKGATEIAKALDSYDPPASSAKMKKRGDKKPTPHQVAEKVAEALFIGDYSMVHELDSVAAKISYPDRRTLLLCMVIGCGGEAADALHHLVRLLFLKINGRLVLNLTLCAGNTSLAKALISPEVNNDAERALCLNADSHNKFIKPFDEKRYLSLYTAVDTLLAISKEQPVDSSIALGLAKYLFASLDAKEALDMEPLRRLLSAGLISKEEAMDLPWDSLLDKFTDPIHTTRSSGLKIESADVLGLVRDYATNGQERITEYWRPCYATRDYLRTLLLFVDVLDTENGAQRLEALRTLLEAGYTDEFKKLASKPGWLTKQRIKILVDVAGEIGQIEIQAWLLEQAGQNDGKSRAISLQL